ncbi:hypothetical protein GCM10009127_03210 [Alteraurantiacibacter aestuarii]|uniref:Nucleotidyltransferase family protein n=1 Tax=Alteraurantiacibacter aestuarii TaxID=650004 RepID=A0A844ZKT8_9SPHN|nr:nucleotidyltransferase family protein [Alteraurantiacibacter aestuarii]MXO88425.1 hypothetical protein [Alteraurantiacibacter aestuarii]
MQDRAIANSSDVEFAGPSIANPAVGEGDIPAIDEFLAGLGRPGPMVWPTDLAPVSASAVMQRVNFHGVVHQLHARLPELANFPAGLLQDLRKAAALQALWEESHRATLVHVLELFHAAGIDVLVMKGTALAYSLYPSAAARSRTDSDLLVRKEQLARAREILGECGYDCLAQGRIFQESWWADSGIGFVHSFDLHWQVTNMPALRRLFDVEECFARSRPLPKLCGSARGTDPVTTFMQGCVNQSLHEHYGYYVDGEKLKGTVRLIWLLDNHLLASSFSQEDWSELTGSVMQRHLAPICLAMLEQTVSLFGTQVPQATLEQWRAAPSTNWVTHYIGTANGFSRFRSDLQGCPDMRSRFDLVTARLCPGRDQMRERFPDLGDWPLPILYLLRLVAGPFRLLARRSRS